MSTEEPVLVLARGARRTQETMRLLPAGQGALALDARVVLGS